MPRSHYTAPSISQTFADATYAPLGNVRVASLTDDALQVTDAAMTNGSGVLTSATGLFTSAHVGRRVIVEGAAADTYPLVSSVASYQSATQVTLADNAGTTVSGKTATWGTDVTTALQTFLSGLAQDDYAVIPNPTIAYFITSTLTLPAGMASPKSVTIDWQNVRLVSSVVGPAIDTNEHVQNKGRIIVECPDGYAIRFGGVASTAVRRSTFERVEVWNPAMPAVLFTSTLNYGCYFNLIEHLVVRGGVGGGVKVESQGATPETNGNRIGFCSIQNGGGSGDGVLVNRADEFSFGWLDVQSVGGYGINLTECRGFHVADGWIEANTAGGVNIADYSAVQGDIDIRAFVGSGTITHNYDARRGVSVLNTYLGTKTGGKVRYDVYSTAGSFTWRKPVWATAVDVVVVAGGAGGGSGRRGAAGTVRCGGGGGAASGYSWASFDASQLAATETVVVGAGGAGGAAVTANDTDGNVGTSGTGSTFGTTTLIRGGAGTGGAGGSATAGAGGTAGSGGFAGGGGAAASTTGLVGAQGTAPTGAGPGGGGSGGGITSGDAVSNGGTGGICHTRENNGTPAAGVAPGGNGNADTVTKTNSTSAGYGGSGGASSITGTGGTGGAGLHGSGGGGGGASLNGNNSGAGGAGGDGLIVVISRGG